MSHTDKEEPPQKDFLYLFSFPEKLAVLGEAAVSAGVKELSMRLGIEFVALGKEYSYSWSVKKRIMSSVEQGHSAISNAMLGKLEPDISDLEKGVVSNAHQMLQYTCSEGCFAQSAKISDAGAVLKRNTEMTQYIQNAYVEEFGEGPPDFDEMNTELLENICVIKANIDISERAAALSEMSDTVDKLREVYMTANGGDRNIAAEAIEKYDNAVKLSGDMNVLLAALDETRDAVCSIRNDRIRNARAAVQSRGINGQQYCGSMYEYAKSVREMLESTYKDLPFDGYINPWNDDQIQNAVLGAEEYFKSQS